MYTYVHIHILLTLLLRPFYGVTNAYITYFTFTTFLWGYQCTYYLLYFYDLSMGLPMPPTQALIEADAFAPSSRCQVEIKRWKEESPEVAGVTDSLQSRLTKRAARTHAAISDYNTLRYV